MAGVVLGGCLLVFIAFDAKGGIDEGGHVFEMKPTIRGGGDVKLARPGRSGFDTSVEFSGQVLVHGWKWVAW